MKIIRKSIGFVDCLLQSIDHLKNNKKLPDFNNFTHSCRKIDQLSHSFQVMSFLLIVGCILQAILHYCMILITPTTSSTITIEATTFDNAAETYPETSQTNTQTRESTTHENVEATNSLPQRTSTNTQQQEETAIYENVETTESLPEATTTTAGTSENTNGDVPETRDNIASVS